MAYRPLPSVIPQIQQDFREFGPIVTGFIFERNVQNGSVDQVYAALQSESDTLFKMLNSQMGPENVFRVLGDILGCILQDLSLVQRVLNTYPPYELLKGTLDSGYLKGMVHAVTHQHKSPQPPVHHNRQPPQRAPFAGGGGYGTQQPAHSPVPAQWQQPLAPPSGHHYPPPHHSGAAPFPGWHHPSVMGGHPMYPPQSVFGHAPPVSVGNPSREQQPPPSPQNVYSTPPLAPTPVVPQQSATPPPVTCAVTRNMVRTVTHAPPSIDDVEEPGVAPIAAQPPQPTMSVCPLQAFLDEHSKGHLLEDLQEAGITLPELQSLPPERFHSRLRTVICSQAIRTELLQALHPDGAYPIDNHQPTTNDTSNSVLMSFMQANAITLRSTENAASKAKHQTETIRNLLKLPSETEATHPPPPPPPPPPHTHIQHEKVRSVRPANDGSHAPDITLCRFYGRGTCVRGDSCKYAHVSGQPGYSDRRERGSGRGRGAGRGEGQDAKQRRIPRPEAPPVDLPHPRDTPASYAAAVQGAKPTTSPDPQQTETDIAARRRKGNEKKRREA